jgi:hypothetical protein
MPTPPITVQLSKFELIEILRLEIEAREEELRQTEIKIRDVLLEIERLKYLQSLSTFYAKQPQPQDAGNLPQLAARREALGEAIETLQAALTALEKETVGQVAPAARLSSPARAGVSGARRKFDSFEDFRSNR